MTPRREKRGKLASPALSSTLRLSTSPSPLRSSVSIARPLRTASAGVAKRTSLPSSRTDPASAGRAPKIALATSVRPLPTRPNMPTISPARTAKLTSSKLPRRPSRSTSSTTRPGSPPRSGKIADSGRPTMARMIRSWSSSATGAASTLAPSLSTTISSAISKISSSRCEM